MDISDEKKKTSLAARIASIACLPPGWDFIRQPSEMLRPLGIMGTQLRNPLKPLGTTLLWCTKGHILGPYDAERPQPLGWLFFWLLNKFRTKKFAYRKGDKRGHEYPLLSAPTRENVEPSRHHGGLMKRPLIPIRTSKHYHIEKFDGDPWLGPHYAERCESLGQWMKFFPVWTDGKFFSQKITRSKQSL